VRTGKEAAEQQAQDLSDALGFIRTALLVFAAVALLVGGFLIFNTFTVTVAQRTKEFALLRVLGASRGRCCARAARDVRVGLSRRARRPRRARCSRPRWRRC
jgi:putative ABC transport system permease protein